MSTTTSISSLGSQSSAIDSLVAQYMALESRPITALQAKKSNLNALSGLYTELSGKLLGLENLAEELTETESSVFEQSTVTSGDGTVIDASVGSDAAAGNYLFRIKQLATATTMKSTAKLNTAYSTVSSAQAVAGSGTIDTSESFADAGFDTTPDGSVTINGQTFNLSDYSTVDAFMTAINGDATAMANIYYDDIRDKFFIESDTPGGSLVLSESGTNPFFSEVNIATGTFTTNNSGVQSDVLLYRANFDNELGQTDSGSFKINGVTIDWDADEDTLNEILSRINSSATGVTAFYDDTMDKVIISSSTTGSENIAFEDVTGTLLNNTLKFSGVTQNTGSDAKFTINSTSDEDEITKSANTFEINGVTYTLKSTNVSLYTDSTYTKVTVVRDNSAITTKITNFLSRFNSIVDYIRSRTSVNITTYTRGALAGESSIRSLRGNLISAMMEEISSVQSGNPGTLREIGITFNDDMDIVISDLETFDEVLTNNPQAVEDLFNSSSGIAVRIKDLLEPFTEDSGIIEDKQDIITEHIEDIDERIERFEERMTRRESQLRSQFASMQQALYLVVEQQSLMQAVLASIGGVTGLS